MLHENTIKCVVRLYTSPGRSQRKASADLVYGALGSRRGTGLTRTSGGRLSQEPAGIVSASSSGVTGIRISLAFSSRPWTGIGTRSPDCIP